MNTQKNTLRSILAIYAFIIAFLKIGLSLHSIRMAFRHFSVYALPYADIIIVVVLITAAVGVIKKAGWSGTLYIISMGMIMPKLLNSVFSFHYIGSFIAIILVALSVYFAFNVRNLVDK